jgi:hypothetical protein
MYEDNDSDDRVAQLIRFHAPPMPRGEVLPADMLSTVDPAGLDAVPSCRDQAHV